MTNTGKLRKRKKKTNKQTNKKKKQKNKKIERKKMWNFFYADKSAPKVKLINKCAKITFLKDGEKKN